MVLALIVPLITPLILALTQVWRERSRRKTYRVLLTAALPGTVLRDSHPDGRSLVLIRDRNHFPAYAMPRPLSACDANER
ncbi:hypothetical protein ACFWPX_33390 [Nocardia sp. NPDC058518]|uniref:hypothetical protein n=1 Tax=Nocardia sp. NPDC058518 TaxID=3346534 RepID=UPI0036533C01